MSSEGTMISLMKVMNKHLEDIAQSLRVISGREEPLGKVIKKPSYAESYLSKGGMESKNE